MYKLPMIPFYFIPYNETWTEKTVSLNIPMQILK